MRKAPTRMNSCAPITQPFVAGTLSSHLQRLFHTEAHAVKRIARMLDIGLSRAEKILYGEAAPTAAQIFQLMRELDPAFAPALINALSGKGTGPGGG